MAGWTNGYTEQADQRTTNASGTQDAVGTATLVFDADGITPTSTTATFSQSGANEPDRATGILLIFNVAATAGLAGSASDTASAAADMVGSPVAPVVKQIGTAVSGTGAISPAWPTHTTGDVALLLVESAGGEAVTLSTPAGFAAVVGSPWATGSGTTGTRLTAFWCRATGSSMGAPTVADSGDHQVAQIITIGGCNATDSPFDVIAGSVKGTASTSNTMAGPTTTVDQALILAIATRDNDSASTTQFSGWTNSNLLGLAELTEAGTTSGNGGGFGIAAGVMVNKGAVGNTTVTLATSSTSAYVVLALKPPQPASSPTLAGAPAAVATASGALTNAITAAGGATAVATTTGALTAAIRFAGAPTAQAAATGALATPGQPAQFQGDAIARSVATGALITEIRMAGAVLGVATLSAPSLAKQVVLGGAATGRAQAVGGLTALITMAGALDAQAAATGDLRPAVDLFWDNVASNEGYRIKWGTSSGVYGNFQDVGTNITTLTLWGLQPSTIYYWRVVALVGGVEQTPSAESTFNTFPAKTFSGAVVANATLTGGLAQTHVLGGALSAQATASGTLYKPIPLAGAAMSVATVSGGMVADIRLSGAALAQALMQGQLYNASPGQSFAATAQAVATAAGALTVTPIFQAAAFASATAAGALTTNTLLSGSAPAQSTVTGFLSAPSLLSGAAVAQAIAEGELRMQIWFGGDAVVDSLMAGQMVVVPSLIGGSARYRVPAEPREFRVRAPGRVLQ